MTSRYDSHRSSSRTSNAGDRDRGRSRERDRDWDRDQNHTASSGIQSDRRLSSSTIPALPPPKSQSSSDLKYHKRKYSEEDSTFSKRSRKDNPDFIPVPDGPPPVVSRDTSIERRDPQARWKSSRSPSLPRMDSHDQRNSHYRRTSRPSSPTRTQTNDHRDSRSSNPLKPRTPGREVDDMHNGWDPPNSAKRASAASDSWGGGDNITETGQSLNDVQWDSAPQSGWGTEWGGKPLSVWGVNDHSEMHSESTARRRQSTRNGPSSERTSTQRSHSRSSTGTNRLASPDRRATRSSSWSKSHTSSVTDTSMIEENNSRTSSSSKVKQIESHSSAHIPQVARTSEADFVKAGSLEPGEIREPTSLNLSNSPAKLTEKQIQSADRIATTLTAENLVSTELSQESTADTIMSGKVPPPNSLDQSVRPAMDIAMSASVNAERIHNLEKQYDVITRMLGSLSESVNSHKEFIDSVNQGLHQIQNERKTEKAEKLKRSMVEKSEREKKEKERKEYEAKKTSAKEKAEKEKREREEKQNQERVEEERKRVVEVRRSRDLYENRTKALEKKLSTAMEQAAKERNSIKERVKRLEVEMLGNKQRDDGKGNGAESPSEKTLQNPAYQDANSETISGIIPDLDDLHSRLGTVEGVIGQLQNQESEIRLLHNIIFALSVRIDEFVQQFTTLEQNVNDMARVIQDIKVSPPAKATTGSYGISEQLQKSINESGQMEHNVMTLQLKNEEKDRVIQGLQQSNLTLTNQVTQITMFLRKTFNADLFDGNRGGVSGH
ncbi:hypothetical protein BKA69DRAFT_1166052 [Paraphysoderma sedebokerense]|nr:hypothetical protein BKA69DRAFT_1166052 [Paraphysoderma sedebokerense]